MNIYQVVPDPYHLPNPYVRTLIDSLKKQFDDVHISYGLDLFWTNDIFKQHIVHFHWHDLLGKEKIDIIEPRLHDIKAKGIKIVATCHNFIPHYTKDPQRIESYQLIYRNADLIIHLGDYSKNMMVDLYPQAIHTIIPHHVYDGYYPKFVSRDEGLKRLHLNKNKTYILCLGQFRDEEERQLIYSVSKQFHNQDIVILAPSLFVFSKNASTQLKARQWIYKKKFEFKHPGIKVDACYVSDEMIPYYYAVSTLSFIHRLKILNSGNVPLGLYMGKVIVGPNMGNVGCLLKDTGNVTFEVNDMKSVFDAIEKGIQLSRKGLGEKNHLYAINKMGTDYIAKKMYISYCRLFM